MLSSGIFFKNIRQVLRPSSAGLRTRSRDFTPVLQNSDVSNADPSEILRKDVIDRVNAQIEDNSHGRLFAVVSIRGHQHKLTNEDLVMIQNDLGAPLGQRIILDKVMLLGSKDFTLIGRPLLPRDLVRVEATVVEKSPSETKVRQSFIRRNNHLRYKFVKNIHTTLRINRIAFVNKLEETEDLSGFDGNNAHTNESLSPFNEG